MGKLIPGEQNSHIISSIMATYLALVGYQVHILNNSPVGNNINERRYSELNDQLSVGNRVCYGTMR